MVEEAPHKAGVDAKRETGQGLSSQGFPPPWPNHPFKHKIRVKILIGTSTFRIFKTKMILKSLGCVLAKVKVE